MSETAGPPKIFDRALLRRRLRRAMSKGAPDFLMTRAADDLLDRLLTVKREFSRSLDLGSPSEHFAQAVVASGRARPLRASGFAGDVVADEETPPFAPGSFDLIVSGMSLQWVNDLPGALAQARRMLAPDGLFLACLAGGASLVELRAALAQAEEEITGGASPRVSPFVDVRDMGGLLQRAGFALPVADVDSFTLRYEFNLRADARSARDGRRQRSCEAGAQTVAAGCRGARGANLRRALLRRRRTRARELRNRLGVGLGAA